MTGPSWAERIQAQAKQAGEARRRENAHASEADDALPRALTGTTVWRDGVCYLVSRVGTDGLIDTENAHLTRMDGRGHPLVLPWVDVWGWGV